MNLATSKRVFFMLNEKIFLEKLVLRNKDILENKRTDCDAIINKKKTWFMVTKEYNNYVGPQQKRTVNQLKKCWENMKTRKKMELKIGAMGNCSQALVFPATKYDSCTQTTEDVEYFLEGVYSKEETDSFDQYIPETDGVGSAHSIKIETEDYRPASDQEFHNPTTPKCQCYRQLLVEEKKLKLDVLKEELAIMKNKKEQNIVAFCAEQGFLNKKRELELEILKRQLL